MNTPSLTFLRTSTLALLLCAPLAAQQVTPAEGDFELTLLRTEHIGSKQMFGLVQQLYARQVAFPDGRVTPNLMLGNGALLIYETADRLAEIRRTIAQLDVPNEQGDDRQVSIVYEPRAQNGAALERTLAPLLQLEGPPGTGLKVIRQERGHLLLHGSEQAVGEAKRILEQVDRPSPQVMLSAFVLIGGDAPVGHEPARELEDALREVMPYAHYRVHAASVVRIAAEPMRQFSIELADVGDAPAPDYALHGLIGAYDPERGSMMLESLRFEQRGGTRTSGVLLETATTVFAGEYAVLGVAGGDPVFIVVRLKPVPVTAKEGEPRVVRRAN
ncbi:MAG: hypothetical protein H6835_04855 [Planctomycetes bacterium]|nr:hypothetical protein [Planctomycetota bacterium]